MSFDLIVTGGSWISIETWLDRVATLGSRIDLHPDFVPMDHRDWLPGRLEITRFDLFPAARSHLASGPWHAGFDFDLYPAPNAPDEWIAAKRATFQRQVARLRELNAPAVVLDHLLEQCALLGEGPQSVFFGTPGARTVADVVAQLIGAAAYALAADAEFLDPQTTWGPLRGDSILETVAPTIEQFVAAPFNPAALFDRWYD